MDANNHREGVGKPMRDELMNSLIECTSTLASCDASNQDCPRWLGCGNHSRILKESLLLEANRSAGTLK